MPQEPIPEIFLLALLLTFSEHSWLFPPRLSNMHSTAVCDIAGSHALL